MEITTDVALRGEFWNQAIEKLEPIFKTRTNYMIYILSMAIGIKYDKRIEKFDSDEIKSVPRNVLTNNANDKLDFIFQAAILSTTTENLTEEERLNLAFGEKTNFKKIEFLTQFANFGVTKLVELIGINHIESMENILRFFVANIDENESIDDNLTYEILLEED